MPVRNAYFSIRGLKKGTTLSIPSIFAKDCTKAIGIIKKKVRKNNATAMINRRTVREKNGIERLGQYTSRGSGAHSVSQIVGLLDCCVCAQTAAPHRVLKETNAAGIIAFWSFIILSLSDSSCVL